MGEKIENAAEVLGYIVLGIVVILAMLVAMVIFRWIARIYNRWKYDSLQRQTAEFEWEHIRESWLHQDRQDEDRNTLDQDVHDTLDLFDISEQLYNYQEELNYEGR